MNVERVAGDTGVGVTGGRHHCERTRAVAREQDVRGRGCRQADAVYQERFGGVQAGTGQDTETLVIGNFRFRLRDR